MSRRYYSNLATQQTLQSSITSSDTTLIINDSFSGWPTSYPFDCTLDTGKSSMEIVTITAITGTTATITRGQGGTSAIGHSAGGTVDLTVTARDFDEANDHVNSDSGVHGVTGDVVGTTDTQTLTNKTLTSPTISGPTVSGTLAAADITVSGTLDVTGTSTLTGDVTASGDLTVSGTSTLTGNTTVTGTLTVGGNQVKGDVFPSGVTAIAGTAPSSGTVKIRKEGSITVTTNSGGTAVCTYPTAFPNGVTSLVLCPGDVGNSLGFLVIGQSSNTVSGFAAAAYSTSGSLIASKSIRINYFAVGW